MFVDAEDRAHDQNEQQLLERNRPLSGSSSLQASANKPALDTDEETVRTRAPVPQQEPAGDAQELCRRLCRRLFSLINPIKTMPLAVVSCGGMRLPLGSLC